MAETSKTGINYTPVFIIIYPTVKCKTAGGEFCKSGKDCIGIYGFFFHLANKGMCRGGRPCPPAECSIFTEICGKLATFIGPTEPRPCRLDPMLRAFP